MNEAITSTLDATPPEEFGMDGSGFKLRDARSVHPIFDPDARMNYEGREPHHYDFEAPRVDDDDNYHYPDGTIVDAGPVSSLELDDPYHAVDWHGLAIAESFDIDRINYPYRRVSYNTHTGELIADSFNGTHYSTQADVHLPPERINNPDGLVNTLIAAPNTADAIHVLINFFDADANTDALTFLADADITASILD